MKSDGPAVPLIVTALLGSSDFAWLDQLRRTHYPAELNRVPVHLTLFRHLPPSLERELAERLSTLTARAAPEARLAGIMDLGFGTAFRVDSAELEQLREELAAAFHGMMIPQDNAPWQLHITIQNKVDPRVARKLQSDLRAAFRPQPLAIAGLASWHYRSGPWELLKRHMFRR